MALLKHRQYRKTLSRKLIFFLASLIFWGCQDNSDRFLESTTVFMCNQSIHLGSPIPGTLRSSDDFLFDETSSSFILDCNERGIISLGAEKKGAQLMYIQDLELALDSRSRVTALTGYWYELNPHGRERIEEARRLIHQSKELKEQVEELESSTVKLNDLSRVRKELTTVYGEPEALRPMTWRFDDGLFSYNSTDTAWETIYWVHISLE